MEKSESGSPIYRYDKSGKKKFEGASGESSMEEISKHIEQHIGEKRKNSLDFFKIRTHL